MGANNSVDSIYNSIDRSRCSNSEDTVLDRFKTVITVPTLCDNRVDIICNNKIDTIL